FQSFNLVPTLDAYENITLPMDLAGRKPDPVWVERIVETVGLAHRLDHRPSELSGGQQQRVAVARAVAGEPALLLADEPTGNLDSKNGDAVMELLRELHRAGTTIVMVTHNPDYARHAERTIHLFDGRVI
ncbi:MAG: ATP-binding cassette domain-containing protein, partial [Myxococcales bacterium]|nr:ATP-binding cassette domain-containing protein [Myxococcales bacterium]